MKPDWMDRVRSVGPIDVLVEEMARRLAGELSAWPLEVEWTDEATRRKFAPLYAEPGRRPSEPALREALRLARLELQRDYEAIDFFARNEGAGRAAPDPYDRLALELAWRYVVESLLTVAEATEGRVKRAHLLDCLARAEGRLFSA